MSDWYSLEHVDFFLFWLFQKSLDASFCNFLYCGISLTVLFVYSINSLLGCVQLLLNLNSMMVNNKIVEIILFASLLSTDEFQLNDS